MIKGGIRDELHMMGAFNAMAPKHRTKVLSVDWQRMVNEVHQDHIDGSKLYFEQVMIPHPQQTTHFCTGSSYTGQWNQLGMTDSGKFVFPHGCEYEGGFEDGMFHGEGTLTYPMGQKLDGVWEKGRMVAYKFCNADALDYNENWAYCVMPDRRFNLTLREGLQPAGREFMTNQDPIRPLPPGKYDTGDGFYDPVTRTLLLAREPGKPKEDEESASQTHSDEGSPPSQPQRHGSIDSDSYKYDDESVYFDNNLTMVSADRHDWIVNNCRKGWDEPAGYRPDFYEAWISGRAKELENLDRVLQPKIPTRYSLDGIPNDVTTVEEKLKTDDYAGTGRKLLPRMFRGDERN